MAAILGPIGNLADHALRYAIAGLEVFPANPRTKAPLTPNGMKDATTAEGVVIEWWRQHPDASIAHRLPAGVVVADIDFRHGGDATWRALVKEFGPMPATRVHYSGRGDGGGHVWFRHPDGKLSTHALDAWAEEHDVGEHHDHTHTAGVDLLHHGHRYTILPPSLHATSGNAYRWKGDGLAVAVADMPEWLAGLLVQKDGNPCGVSSVGLSAVEVRSTGLPANNVDHSIADWYSEHGNWRDILQPHGWVCRTDGNADGAVWLHPRATSDKSATITHGCLFVYTPNTPFDVTEDGNPHGYTRFAAYALLAHGGDQSKAAKALHAARYGSVPTTAIDEAWAGSGQRGGDGATVEGPPFFLDWPEFFTADRDGAAWLYEDVLARGRGHAFIAKAKVGKSLLALYMAAAMATTVVDPVVVVYLDYEMSPDDLWERLDAMGYGADTDLELLRYAMLPTLPPLDTEAGAKALLAIVDAEHAARPHLPLVVIVDTLGRAVVGEENSADTVRAFYRHTGQALKQRGHTWARLDHLGKDKTKGARGSSAKNDDVDVVWSVERTEKGLRLTRAMSRIGWVPASLAFLQETDPLRFVITDEIWPEGTKAAADLFGDLGLPLDVSQRKARELLKANHVHLAEDVLRAAIRWRHREADISLLK